MTKKTIIVSLVSLVLASSHLAEAQQPKKVPRIGYLVASDPATDSARLEAIRPALRDLGYVEGQNIAFEHRYAEGKRGRQPELAAQLVRLKLISSWYQEETRWFGRPRMRPRQRSRSQTFACCVSLRLGQCEQFTRGEKGSPSRGACAGVDCSVLGGARCGQFREGLRCAKQGAPRWTLRNLGTANA
jgi:hypothetical protein